ncbi:MAG: von Willebrand factor type domain protein [Phycisphaerales bacterium]|nr:von Willebrand factor type domain protein [Phycisphaerales bacterium]
MRHRLLGLVASLALCSAAHAGDPIGRPVDPVGVPSADRPVGPADDKPRIAVVFCIDCSGSMGPVIDAAKQKVWAIVNQAAKAKPSPVLRIGLIGYGNGLGPFRTFPLTDDLDTVYERLMTFKDEGWGDEFVGLAVHRATTNMAWATGRQTLKVVYVVGNETALQGPANTSYTRTTPVAAADGIVVNAVYCGNVDYEAATPTWREMARLGDGRYMEIAQTGGVRHVATPFDDELSKLSDGLNNTYVPFGAQGRGGADNQMAQDANAAGLGKAVAADRAAAKSAVQYRNARWDLVDAAKEKDFKLSTVTDEQLPAELRKLTLEQRRAYVDRKAKERESIQDKIKELAAKRDAFVRDELAKKGGTGDKALETAVRESLTEQARTKGFKFE